MADQRQPEDVQPADAVEVYDDQGRGYPAMAVDSKTGPDGRVLLKARFFGAVPFRRVDTYVPFSTSPAPLTWRYR